MKVVTVRLNDDEQATLEKLCARTGKTQSALVKEAVVRLAAAVGSKTPHELAQQFGLIGAFDGPRDLSVKARKYIKASVRGHRHR